MPLPSIYGEDLARLASEHEGRLIESGKPRAEARKLALRQRLLGEHKGLLRYMLRCRTMIFSERRFFEILANAMTIDGVKRCLQDPEPDYEAAFKLALQHTLNQLTGSNVTLLERIAVLDKALHLSRKILQAQIKLRSILDNNEEVIHRWWLQRGPQERQDILLRAWPGMVPFREPRCWSLSGRQSNRSRAQHIEGHVWPYINVQDLEDDDRFLLLLYFRSRIHPGVFAHGDLLTIAPGVENGFIQVGYLNDTVIALDPNDNSGVYGSLRLARATQWFLSDTDFLPGEGLVVLKIQSRIMRFLLKCCRGILDNIQEPEGSV
ncbi:hypothetical protein F5Y04DRAFT_287192 [Hypomontagnella monticulosa]|nr:hypothetical protein F5Y04DRAFT_287192 [Hypomontagnella monticulosa]